MTKSARRFAISMLGVALCLPALAPGACALENPNAMTEETAQPAIVVTLEKATAGLQMMSETDAPFVVVYFENKTSEAAKTEDAKTEKTDEAGVFDTQKLAELAGAPKDAKIETRDLAEFFEAAATVEDWMNADEKTTAARFAALLETLQTQLKNPQVLVWGEAEKQVAIIGACQGGLAGVTTLIVET